MNIHGISAIYRFEMARWKRTLWQSLITPVITTALYFVVFGSALGSRMTSMDGVSFGAGGGGLSAVFPRPVFQIHQRSLVGDHRGTPDISLSSAVDGGCWVYYTFVNPTSPWHIFGGTSEASPIFSGIVAMADQVAGHRLGDINGALYLLGFQSQLPHFPLATGIVDVTIGDNSFNGVTGFPAAPGYDLASGWGTIDGAKFVPALARL